MAQPIFIIGAARSGTKYLRDILATAPNACKVPYDVNYIWRYGFEQHPDDVLPPEQMTAKQEQFIRTHIHRLAKTTPDAATVLFEKTVSNTLRVPYILRAFPDAKFIHLIRDGRSVTESSMRQWEAPPDWGRLVEKFRGMPLQNLGYAAWFVGDIIKGKLERRKTDKLWGPRYPGIVDDVRADVPLAEICAKQWAQSVATAQRDLAVLPADRVITIRYDDLVGGEDVIRQLCGFCALEASDAVVAHHLSKVDKRTDAKWRTAMSDTEKTQMMQHAGALLEQLGYRE